MPIDYDDIDPYEVCMSALATGLASGLGEEELWIACNVSENAGEFDVAIQASCELKDLIDKYNKKIKP